MSDFIKKVHDVMNTSGKNWVDAAKEVRNTNDMNIATPTATTNVNTPIVPQQTPLQTVESSPNTMTGVNGEVFRVVNNPDLTPKNIPVNTVPQPVQNTQNNQQIKSDVITNPNYWNTGVGREQEIVQNISEGIKNDARVQNAIATGDQESFKKIYGYDTADETKKKILDNQWAGSVKNDPDSLFSGIIAGRSYGENIQKLPEFKNAQSRANNYIKFASASVNELASYMNSGQLLQGTQAYNDLMKNPEMAQKIQQAKVFAQNRGNMNLMEVGEKTSQEIRQNSPITVSMFDDGVITPDEYRQALQTPEITTKMQDVETKKNKYDEIKAKMKQIEEDVNNDTKYSGISATGKAALISDRQKALRYEMEIATDEYNNAVGTLTEMQKTQASILEMNYSLYKDNLAFNRQKEMSVFNSNLELTQKSRLFDLEQQKMREAMNDPYQAIPKMLDEFAKIGVTTQRSQQEIIDEANAYVAQGGNLGEYMSKLRGLMQEKPEYQRYMAIQRGQMSDMEKLQAGQDFQLKQMALENQYGMQKMAIANQYDVQNALMQYNLKTASDRENAVVDMVNNGIDPVVANAHIRSATNNWKGASGQELLFAPEGTLIPTRLSQTTNKNGGKECAEWVNDITGIGFGSLYSDKLSKAKEKSGTIGSVAVWKPVETGEYAKYGHVGIIVGDDGKGNWLIKSSNYNVDGKISVDKVPKSKIDGYRSTNLGEKILQSQSSGKSSTTEITDKQYTQFNQAINRFHSNAQVKAFEETYAQGMNIIASLSDDSGAGDMAGIFALMKSLDPSSVVREGEFAMAAKSAGVVDNVQNIFQKLQNGEMLSNKQRQNFQKIAKQYIENRAKMYETHYNDTVRILGNQLIPESYYPTNIAKEMRNAISGTANEGIVDVAKNRAISLYNKYLTRMGQ